MNIGDRNSGRMGGTASGRMHAIYGVLADNESAVGIYSCGFFARKRVLSLIKDEAWRRGLRSDIEIDRRWLQSTIRVRYIGKGAEDGIKAVEAAVSRF